MNLFKKTTRFAFEYSLFLVLLIAAAAGAEHAFSPTVADCRASDQLTGIHLVAGHATRAINLR